MESKLSVFLITKNEEANIARCLDSVKTIADEIVIVDSGSSDKTVQIAKQYGAAVYEKPFVSFGEQKNFALSKTSNLWCLSLDADEELTPNLTEEIKQVLQNPQADGYKFIRAFSFLGRIMRFREDKKWHILRLVRKDKASFTDNLVHESLKTSGTELPLNGILLHYSYSDLHHYFEKFNLYTTLEAKEMFQKEKKFSYFKMFYKSAYWFAYTYFWKLGFRNGFQGFLWSTFGFFYFFTSYAKLKFLK